jgi:hypothetical protein
MIGHVTKDRYYVKCPQLTTRVGQYCVNLGQHSLQTHLIIGHKIATLITCDHLFDLSCFYMNRKQQKKSKMFGCDFKLQDFEW